jgi:O-antigen/teichoic acid export membrane protein
MQSRKIAQNFLSILSGQISSFALNFISISLAARHLGVEEFGQFGYLLAVVLVLSKIIDFGFAPIVFREMSIDKEDFRLFNTAMASRFFSFIVMAILYNVYMFTVHVNHYDILFSNLLMLNVIVSSKVNYIREIMDVPFKAHIEMFTPSLLLFVDNALFLILIILMPFVKGGIVYFYVSYLVANIPGFILLFYYLYKKYKYKFSLALYKIGWLFKVSFSIYIFILLYILFQYVDTILLKIYSTKYALGIYAAATRLSVPLAIIPTAIIHTVFPLLNEKESEDEKERYRMPESKMKYLATTFKIIYILPFIISAAFTVKPEGLVGLVFGANYLDASVPTILLLWAQILFFHSVFVNNILYVYDAQKWGIFYSGIIVAVDYMLCIILIPHYAYLGAAWAKVASIAAGWIMTTIILKKYSNRMFFPDYRLILWSIAVIIFAKLICFLPTILFLFVFVSIAFILAIFAGIMTDEEMRFIFTVVRMEKHTDAALKIYNKFSLF